MESIVSAALAPFSRGASRTAKLIAHGGPSDGHLVASFMRFAQEIWIAGNGHAAALSMRQLSSMWDLVFLPGRPAWTSAQGPIHVAKLELHRTGW